jgi:hypothetical protein
MSRLIGKSWADIVQEEEETGYEDTSWANVPWLSEPGTSGQMPSWADVVKRSSQIVEESEYEAQIIEDDQTVHDQSQGNLKHSGQLLGTYADVLRRNLPSDDESEYEAHIVEHATKDFPGDPVGIRAIQSILMSATQMNLSHFHTAGMDSIIAGRASPSAAEAMNSVYTTNNTSMTFESSDDVYALRKQLVGASLMNFVSAVKSDFTGFPDKENIWYEASGKDMYEGSILRIYINYHKMQNHGLTLEDLASESFGIESTNVSPDFMGMIDLNVPDMYLSQWLGRLGEKVCGTFDIKSCSKINSKTAMTLGSDILAVSRVPNIDITTINSNDVTEVEEHYGIEAATSVLALLTGSHIVSDFMARTGKVLSFMKNSVEVTNKGLLTSMGFERPRDDIKRALISKEKSKSSVYESIITGSEFSSVFKLIH